MTKQTTEVSGDIERIRIAQDRILLDQFILFMQVSGVWPCRLEKSEKDSELTASEVFKLREHYLSTLHKPTQITTNKD